MTTLEGISQHPVVAQWYGGPLDGAATTVLPCVGQPFAYGETVYVREGKIVGRFKRKCPLILRPAGLGNLLFADWTQGEWVE